MGPVTKKNYFQSKSKGEFCSFIIDLDIDSWQFSLLVSSFIFILSAFLFHLLISSLCFILLILSAFLFYLHISSLCFILFYSFCFSLLSPYLFFVLHPFFFFLLFSSGTNTLEFVRILLVKWVIDKLGALMQRSILDQMIWNFLRRFLWSLFRGPNHKKLTLICKNFRQVPIR